MAPTGLTRFNMLRGIYSTRDEKGNNVHYGTSPAVDTETGERLQRSYIDIDLAADRGLRLARWLDLQGFIHYKPDNAGQPTPVPVEEVVEIDIDDLLRKNVGDITAFVSTVGELQDLKDIRQAEIAGANRTGVVKALDTQLARVGAGE
jgi:hypothetical protein